MGKKEKEFKNKYKVKEEERIDEEERISSEHKLSIEYLREVLNKDKNKEDKTKKPLEPIDPIYLKDEGEIITHQDTMPER